MPMNRRKKVERSARSWLNVAYDIIRLDFAPVYDYVFIRDALHYLYNFRRSSGIIAPNPLDDKRGVSGEDTSKV